MLREINNIGEPLRSPDGAPLGGIKITFVLCTAQGLPMDALDVGQRDRYFPVALSTTTSKIATEELQIGEFKISLWPTSLADRPVFYKCSASAGMKTFVAPLVASEVPIKFSDFAISGAELTAVGTSALAVHISDMTKHLSAAGLDFLSHCTVSPGGLPLWDGVEWPGSADAGIITASDGNDYVVNIIDTGEIDNIGSPIFAATFTRTA